MRPGSELNADRSAGDAGASQVAADLWMPAIYEELRRLAERYFRGERPEHTLQPTALVHEAFLCLAASDRRYENRGHFMAVAALAMRNLLVSHARSKAAEKRGGAWRQVMIDDSAGGQPVGAVDILALHEALEALAERSPRQARIVELRVFSGQTTEEVAELLEIAPATVKADWAIARAWLKARLAQ
jgi:RNA polymerase sigma-70 factor (ECF subfamily)